MNSEHKLYETRQRLIKMAPEQFRADLHGYGHPMKTFDDMHNWCRAVVNRVIAEATGACPLCGQYRRPGFYDDREQIPWTEIGLESHLRGSHGVRQCLVFEAAEEILRDENLEEFRLAMRAEDEQRKQERAQRLKTETVFLLSPKGPPVLIEETRYRGTHPVRSAEDLAATEERFREAGVTVERTNNVVAYRMMHGDDFMLLADPRLANQVSCAVFKRYGNSWKHRGAFVLRGTKNWSKIIPQRFQAITKPKPRVYRPRKQVLTPRIPG